MNDVGRYRLVYPRLWRHPGFRQLSRSSRELALYLLAGPQSNRLGVFHLSVATAAEDLNASADTIRKGLADVAGTFGWLFDSRAGVFYIPSWWRWNRPQNPKHLQGNLKDLNEIAPSELVEAFARNLGTLPDTFHQTFLEGIARRLLERPANQNLDLDLNQKQKHGRRATRGIDGVNPSSGQPVSDRQVEIARKTLTFEDAGRPIEHLQDAFINIARSEGIRDCTAAQARSALAIALSEHRLRKVAG